jgi:general stress protein CsbA
MNKKSLSKEIIFFLITVCISTCFGTYLSSKKVTDPFLYYDISFVKSIQDERQMNFPDVGPYKSLSLAPGRSLILAQYANMMGVNPEALQFIPLGSLLISTTFYYLALRTLKSPIIACLITLYLILNLSHATALYSVFAYGIALPILFGVMLVYMNLFERKETIDIVLLLLLFIAANFIHYTIATWVILFLIGANLLVGFRTVTDKYQQSYPQSNQVYYLTSAFIVIFFTFNQAIYESFLPFFGSSSLDGAVQNFLSYLSFGTAENFSPYSFPRSSVIGLVSTFTLLLILVPIMVGLIYNIWNHFKHSPTERVINAWTPILGGILLIGLVDSAVYSVRGSISTKAFSIIFPLLTLHYFQRIGKHSLAVTMAIILFATSVIKIGVFYENSYLISNDNLNTSINGIYPSSEWMAKHETQDKYYLLADLNLYGKYLLSSVNDSKKPIFLSFDDNSYAKVIGESNEAWKSTPDIIAVDVASTEPLIGFVWGRYKPLKEYADRIINNPAINLVYDDGSIWLAKPVN